MEPFPPRAAGLPVICQTLRNDLVERPTELALGGISIRVHHHFHRGPRFPESCQQTLELPIHNDKFNVGELKDIANVILLQPVICRDDDGTACNNAIDRLQECGRVRHQHTYPLEAMRLDVVGQTPGAVREFLIGTAEGCPVGGDMNYSFGVGFYRGGSGKEGCW